MKTALDNILSPREVSARLRLTPTRIRQWCADGRLEHLRIGRKIWIPSAELDRIVSDGMRPRRRTA